MTVLPVLLAAATLAASGLTGVVLDPGDNPVPGASVYFEADITVPLVRVETGPDGGFAFPDMPHETGGLFVVAEGWAYAGRQVGRSDFTRGDVGALRLVTGASLQGVVRDAKGGRVDGARITRVALLEDPKVSIPLAKLQAAGVSLPVTDKRGRFEVPNLPPGIALAVKVSHPQYAQGTVTGVRAGRDTAEVVLQHGAPIFGTVVTRDEGRRIDGAVVLVRDAQPPHGTTVVETRDQGRFALRLRPGVYMAQVRKGTLRSPGWERFVVENSIEERRLNLTLGGLRTVVGTVRDAVSGVGIAGADLRIEADGNVAALTQTDADGHYHAAIAARQVTVHLDAAPGYAAPENPAMRAVLGTQETTEIPAYWLRALAGYELEVVDQQGAAVSGAAVSLLVPRQVGWQFTDEHGRVRLQIAQVPAGGNVIGVAEHPDEAASGVFELGEGSRSSHRVQLVPTAHLTGQVAGPDGEPVQGAVVAAILAGVAQDDVILWRTVSGPSGRYEWPLVAAMAPQQCVAVAQNAISEPVTVHLEPGARHVAGTLLLEAPDPATSLRGRFAPWRTHLDETSAITVFCTADEAPQVIQSLAVAARQLAHAVRMVVAVPGAPPADVPPEVTVITMANPGRATGYRSDATGRIEFECFGLPPLLWLRDGER